MTAYEKAVIKAFLKNEAFGQYEKAVIKAFLNEVFGQLSAEVDGQTIIPGYSDTDSEKNR